MKEEKEIKSKIEELKKEIEFLKKRYERRWRQGFFNLEKNWIKNFKMDYWRIGGIL